MAIQIKSVERGQPGKKLQEMLQVAKFTKV